MTDTVLGEDGDDGMARDKCCLGSRGSPVGEGTDAVKVKDRGWLSRRHF